MTRRLLLFFSFFIALAHTAAAGVIRIDPPAPTTATRVSVSFIAFCINEPKVTITPSKITIEVEAASACISAAIPLRFTVPLGRVPAGVYDLELTGTGVTSATTRLVVRDVEAFEIAPVGAPASGNINARIVADRVLRAPVAVTFGGVPATSVLSIEGGLLVAVPPHAPGDVDVTVTENGGQTLTAKAAFTYFDPAAPPDPFTFEPLLFPIAFNGPGNLGSQWVTENVVKSDYPSLVRGSASINDPAGALLHVVRGSTSNLHLGSRFSDTSLRDDTAGTEVHVAPESDLRSTLRIVNVPAATNSRATLRVWVLSDGAQPPGLSLHAGNMNSFAPTGVVTREGMTMITYDITSALASSTDVVVDVASPVDARAWAVVSLTNNETQQVTLVTPQ